MSRFAVIPVRAIEDERFSMTHLRVLCGLGSHTDKNGWCRPAASTLAKRVNVSRQRVSACIQDLREWGYIEIYSRCRNDGSQTSNMYRVLLDVGMPVDEEAVSDDATAFHAVPPCSEGVQPQVAGVQPPEVAGGATSRGCTMNDPLNDPRGKSTTAAADAPAPAVVDLFAEAWLHYPKRSGGNSRSAAIKAWNARIKQGVSPDVMLAGVKRYALWCAANNRVGTSFVKQAVTFFGPDEHYLEDYAVQHGVAADGKFDPLSYIHGKAQSSADDAFTIDGEVRRVD